MLTLVVFILFSYAIVEASPSLIPFDPEWTATEV